MPLTILFWPALVALLGKMGAGAAAGAGKGLLGGIMAGKGVAGGGIPAMVGGAMAGGGGKGGAKGAPVEAPPLMPVTGGPTGGGPDQQSVVQNLAAVARRRRGLA